MLLKDEAKDAHKQAQEQINLALESLAQIVVLEVPNTRELPVTVLERVNEAFDHLLNARKMLRFDE